MQVVNKVLSKWNKKTELKSEKVELAIGDDLLKLDQKVESLDNDLDNEISNAIE